MIVVNQTYPEGCITECILLNEAMVYGMNYMPNGRKGSHKQGRGRWVDGDGQSAYPIDKRGKVYKFGQVQYRQARKWVLNLYVENDEWEKYEKSKLIIFYEGDLFITLPIHSVSSSTGITIDTYKVSYLMFKIGRSNKNRKSNRLHSLA
eukprot:TRINITY_DN49522_c0_g1_i1.p2 TRINITY_DN49522_c0_g1~~TRINITY_DN49522_c0_g1_i1.p2  ORF type:complete len:149 (+),score=7.44 TRINITY_DN49522_c0_g1_i1:864-1310(+)